MENRKCSKPPTRFVYFVWMFVGFHIFSRAFRDYIILWPFSVCGINLSCGMMCQLDIVLCFVYLQYFICFKTTGYPFFCLANKNVYLEYGILWTAGCIYIYIYILYIYSILCYWCVFSNMHFIGIHSSNWSGDLKEKLNRGISGTYGKTSKKMTGE